MTKRPLIETAVFPVAGRGTRFLPATKASPKEMLPVVDKPLIQYAVEEALAAGARRLVFITGASKRAIEDHFDSDRELESLLKSQGKSELVKQLHSVLPSYATCIYIRQPAPLGLGHAVLCARPAVGNEPFFVHLADDLITSEPGCLSQMAEVYSAKRASVIGCEVVPRSETDKYGIVEVEARGTTARIRSIVEKPKEPRSNWAVTGLYFYDGDAVALARDLKPSPRGELEITDLNRIYLEAGKLNVELMGRGFAWLDTGTHTSLLDAANYVRIVEERQGLKICCPEEIVWRLGHIDDAQLEAIATPLRKSGYGEYLLGQLRDGR